jgi:hypothetical protein
MAAYVARPFRLKRQLKPILPLCPRHHLLISATRRRLSTSSIMDPKISEGENEAQVKADLKALLENGWKLDEEQIQLEKTYYFKTYTKVAVSKTPCCHFIANSLGFAPRNCNEEQVEKPPFKNDHCKDHSTVPQQ